MVTLENFISCVIIWDMNELDPSMRKLYTLLGESINRFLKLPPEEQLEQRGGMHRDLSKFSSQKTVEGEWVTLQHVKIGSLHIRVLKVNTKDVVDNLGFLSLPKQVLAGESPEDLEKFPTFFVQDGYPGRNYVSHFFIKDGNVGYMNGRESGNSRPSLGLVKEAGILCEELTSWGELKT